MRRDPGRRWWPHALLALVGLLILLYPFTLGRSPAVTCRDQVLQPGQVCAKADGSAVQTYEQRAAAARAARPVVVGVGVLVFAFGAALTLSARRSARTGTVPEPAGPPRSGGASAR